MRSMTYSDALSKPLIEGRMNCGNHLTAALQIRWPLIAQTAIKCLRQRRPFRLGEVGSDDDEQEGQRQRHGAEGEREGLQRGQGQPAYVVLGAGRARQEGREVKGVSASHSGSGEILLAGATGGLGLRISKALRARGADVKAVVRHGTAADRIAPLREMGVTVVELDLNDCAKLTSACVGADCVVSALNGLRETIIDTQSVLLDAAVAAGVPRFIPSDFCLDYTRTPAGSNRNMDLRREFKVRLDAAPIRATSILNGAFMDMLTGQAPFILFGPRRAIHWGDANQPIHFTTMDDTAAYTAAAAMDPSAPRMLRIAGEKTSPCGLAAAASDVTGKPFKTLRIGGIGLLEGMIKVARLVMPGKGQVFPPWQGMQYMCDMFSGDGNLAPLDNGRYPDMRWTGVRQVLATR